VSTLRLPPVPAATGTALLLDFDGTLVEFAATPTAVQVDAELLALLGRLSARLDGALAIISGRSIDAIDALLAPLRLPVAGLHGLERRCAAGRSHAPPACGAWLHAARAALREHVAAHPGLLLEEKSHALALHWRGAPQHAATAQRCVMQLQAALQPKPMLIEGHAVAELRDAGPDKGAALDAFLGEAPFRGRLPVYIGDDTTDLPALQRAVQRGGVGIWVGATDQPGRALPPAAAHRLPHPRAVHDWLAALLHPVPTT
jgi:trehalose 6-phosphate phosphatase